ncbi:hypothetical protein EDB86DRAFT_2834356 [Lactarius hatsudake]|nr:hypothetical protein EDB86DRAFT_2834356 [Lactarius hatsudake]
MATLIHISRQLSASLASPERLDVVASSDLFVWRDPGEAEAVQWLEFLRLFPGVNLKRLEVSSTLASIVASAFEQVTRTSDILPSLSELHIGGSQASTSSSIEGSAIEWSQWTKELWLIGVDHNATPRLAQPNLQSTPMRFCGTCRTTEIRRMRSQKLTAPRSDRSPATSVSGNTKLVRRVSGENALDQSARGLLR